MRCSGACAASRGSSAAATSWRLITRLKQVCNHPAHALGKHGTLAGRSGKLDRLTEMLAEVVDEGDSALVFTQYAVMGKLLAEHLGHELGGELLHLDGSTPRMARERIVERVPAAGRRAADAGHVAARRRPRAEPDQREPRVPLRPLVEPGGRGSGVRPRPPDRPDARRAGAPDGVRRDDRGAHRPADRRASATSPPGSSIAASSRRSPTSATTSWRSSSRWASRTRIRPIRVIEGSRLSSDFLSSTTPVRARQSDGAHPR